MDIGHRQVVHEDIQCLYRYMWVVYRGLGGGCVGARSRSGQTRVRFFNICGSEHHAL